MIPSEVDTNISIDPQYDGVVMLSPETVLFNDAQPRPDGRKIYHIFEHASDDVNELFDMNQDLDLKKFELFSKASENTIQNIQQVLSKNGISIQDWCSALSPDVASNVLQMNEDILCNTEKKHPIKSEFNVFNDSLSTLENQDFFQSLLQQQSWDPIEHEILDLINVYNFKLYKVYQFSLNFPAQSCVKNRFLTRLKRRGVFLVECETENVPARLTLKTTRSARFVLNWLRKVDRNATLLNTSYELVQIDVQTQEQTQLEPL